MGNSQRYEFSPEQEAEIGRLVVDHWGGNISQTGFTGLGNTGIPYIAFQMTPKGPVDFFDVDRDGTSVKRRV